MSLRWDSPAEPNGNVSYRVFYRMSGQTEFHNNLSAVVTNTQHRVDGLHKAIMYVFTVQPFTKRGGDGEKRTVLAQTEAIGTYKCLSMSVVDNCASFVLLMFTYLHVPFIGRYDGLLRNHTPILNYIKNLPKRYHFCQKRAVWFLTNRASIWN